MSVNKETYFQLKTSLDQSGVSLVAVSKTKTVQEIRDLYELGQRDFGENYVQELNEKQSQLPSDIRWHFIGHLQSNKVKLIAPYVQLIHGIDSLNLLNEVNKQAQKHGRVIDCLLQVHIAVEESKFGLNEEELGLLVTQYRKAAMEHVRITGLMGMATFTDDMEKVRMEFRNLKRMFDKLKLGDLDPAPSTLSMGMSADYKVAIEEGSNMVRIGSLIFGERS